MDDELQELEAELARLRPVSPDAGLRDRIERRVARRRATIIRIGSVLVPLAAAAAVLLLFQGKPAPVAGPASPKSTASELPPALFKPVAAQNILLDTRDEGYVTLADGRTARQVRRSYLDRITWKNSRTNASMTWSVPREEVRITPVSYE